MSAAQIGCRLSVLPASEDAHIPGEMTVLSVPGENFVGREHTQARFTLG